MENIVNVINDLGLREISFNKEGSKYFWIGSGKVVKKIVWRESTKEKDTLNRKEIFTTEWVSLGNFVFYMATRVAHVKQKKSN